MTLIENAKTTAERVDTVPVRPWRGRETPPAAQMYAATEAMARWATDWAWWQSCPEAAEAVARWRRRQPCLATCATVADVVEVCGWRRDVPQETADACLAALVDEARHGDNAAARVALQRVLPGLARRAAYRRLGSARPRIDILDDLAAAAWTVITRYPMRRRPSKIAVNIIRDADYQVFGYTPFAARAVPVSPERMDWLTEAPVGLDGRPAGSSPSPHLQILELLAEAVESGFPRSDGQLLAELFGLGLPTSELGARHGVTARTIRSRRSAALRRLVAWMSQQFQEPRPAPALAARAAGKQPAQPQHAA